MESKSLSLAKEQLGKIVNVIVDRQKGTKHPKWDFKYPVNYGYLENIIAPDGEELDAYILKLDHPVKSYQGLAVAIVHRTQDDDDKLVVIPKDKTITDKEIENMVEFQEKWFDHIIIR